MGQRSQHAAVEDAQTELRREECASGMEQRSINAAMKDAPIKLRKEECALSMGHRSRLSDAAAKDVQI